MDKAEPGDRVRWESGGKTHFGRVHKAIRGAEGTTYLIARGNLPLSYVHEDHILKSTWSNQYHLPAHPEGGAEK